MNKYAIKLITIYLLLLFETNVKPSICIISMHNN